ETFKGIPPTHQVVCYHNKVAPLRMVRFDGPTKGKHFYGCSYSVVDEVDNVCKLQQIVVERIASC
ncbi:Protein ZGRF1, partial [Bienertia sinuspersici]